VSNRPVLGCSLPSLTHLHVVRPLPFSESRSAALTEKLLWALASFETRMEIQEEGQGGTCVYNCKHVCVWACSLGTVKNSPSLPLWKTATLIYDFNTHTFSRAQSTASGWSFSLLFSFRESFSGLVEREAFRAAWINKMRRSGAFS